MHMVFIGAINEANPHFPHRAAHKRHCLCLAHSPLSQKSSDGYESEIYRIDLAYCSPAKAGLGAVPLALGGGAAIAALSAALIATDPAQRRASPVAIGIYFLRHGPHMLHV